MLYLKKCAYSEGDKRVSHRNAVRAEAHKLLRSALLQNGIPESRQEFVYNKYGKPSLKDDCSFHFNISHCEELAVCATATKPIGADAEKIRKFPEHVLRRCFTEREIKFVRESSSPETAFFQLWTLKESLVKATGKGLSYPLKKAEFIIENNHITVNSEYNLSVLQIIIDKEFICSVCSSNIFNNQIYYRSFEEKISFDHLN